MAPPLEVPEYKTSAARGTPGPGSHLTASTGKQGDIVDVLIVSLGATGGLRSADEELLASLRRAGATATIVRPDPPPPLRTLMLTDLRWALASRHATSAELQRSHARAIVYSSTTAALLWPAPGAIRFDAPASGNRPGRHGMWQRPLERRRLREAPLLLPWSEGGWREAPDGSYAKRALVLPVPVEPSGTEAEPVAVAACDGTVSFEPSQPPLTRDIAAFAYVANPEKKGLDRILEAWRVARRPGDELLLAGVHESELRARGYALPTEGVRVEPMLPYAEYRALLRRTRVFVCAARREDYGIAQLEALADGCMLVTVASPGPYVALPIARALDARLVGEDLAAALRIALDDPLRGYGERALRALTPFRRAAVDRLVAEELLSRLLELGSR